MALAGYISAWVLGSIFVAVGCAVPAIIAVSIGIMLLVRGAHRRASMRPRPPVVHRLLSSLR